ncbi:hypothetical protein U0070_024756 [Myodes glareolus]|uniref:Pre-mRNA-splicing factor SYF2 n=1 Tax=Myodes glareolus TaxID=447135 RepID=A0AAW0H7X1_MYOGA
MAAVTQVEVPVDSVEDWPSEAVQKHEQGLCKFCKLRLKQNEAHKLNDQEVVEEDKRLKLLAEMARKCIWSGNCRRKKRKSSVWRGEDHEKVKLLEISAEDAERWERREKRKNPDLEFSDYAAAQLHQYHQLTKQTKPDVEKEIDRMVLDLEKKIEKIDKYSQRRPYHDDVNIVYISERNAKLNKRVEKFYGKYTDEIK